MFTYTLYLIICILPRLVIKCLLDQDRDAILCQNKHQNICIRCLYIVTTDRKSLSSESNMFTAISNWPFLQRAINS